MQQGKQRRKSDLRQRKQHTQNWRRVGGELRDRVGVLVGTREMTPRGSESAAFVY